MILSHFGRLLVDAYNRKQGTTHDPKSFFDEILIKTIYSRKDFPLNRFAHNSKFRYADTIEEGLSNFHAAIHNNEFHTGTVFGFAATELEANTSGQITSLNIPCEADDAYCSWIADALAIDLQGGVCVLIDNPEILLLIQEGWSEHLKFISQIPNPTAQQIRKWNGAYLVHKLTEISLQNSLNTKKGTSELLSLSWHELVLSLCKQYGTTTQNLYVYSLDKTGNTNIGFVPVYLPSIALFSREFFKLNLGNSDAAKQLKLRFDFREVCKRGFIGLYALEPSDLQQIIRSEKLPNPNKELKNPFHIYKIWIIAMLNDKSLDAYAIDIANTFTTFAQGANQKSTLNTRTQVITDILTVSSKAKLVNSLTNLLEHDATHYEVLASLIQQIGKRPTEEIKLFFALVKFHYVGISKQQ